MDEILHILVFYLLLFSFKVIGIDNKNKLS